MNLPKFKNQKLFAKAFTHRSYLNEAAKGTESNERLEFLGDSILSIVVSEFLYKTYPKFDEGSLTNLRSLLVNTKSLAQIAKKLDFGSYLHLSKGEEISKGRQNQTLLANSFEAFVGALYLDQGLDAVCNFLEKVLLLNTKELVDKNVLKDPKSLLQEYIQSKKRRSPIYKVLKEEGPAHARKFTIGVFVQNSMLASGQGKSKQEAEENAAQSALEKMAK